MDLVDRYLQQVQRYLPAKDQDDIVNELKDDILSEVADQETHPGRPVTEAEMVNLLKHRGHPFLLAQRYRPKQDPLIGPGMLPFYWQTLKASLALAFLVIVIVTAVSAVQGAPPQELWNRLSGFFNVALYIFAWVTGLFAVLDIVQGRMNLQQGWDPRKLPALARRSQPPPRGLEAFTELISTGVFMIWWLAVPHYPWVMLGLAANVIMFTPALAPARLVDHGSADHLVPDAGDRAGASAMAVGRPLPAFRRRRAHGRRAAAPARGRRPGDGHGHGAD